MKRLTLVTGLAALVLPGLLSAAYSFYFTDYFNGSSISTTNWAVNGTASSGSSGFTSSTTNGGSAISKVAVPGGVPYYDLRTYLNIKASGGNYTLYARASQDALNGPASQGTYYAVELQNPTITNGICNATVAYYKRSGGTVTLLSSNAVGCADGMEFRVLVAAGWGVQVFVGGINYAPISDTTITAGAPGVGVRGAPATNGFKQVDLGAVESVAPNAVPVSSIAVTPFANSVDIQWAAVSDDANGRGFWRFNVYRDHQYYATTYTPSYSDATVQPGTTYLYEIQVQDWDCNYVVTGINVVTPASGNVDQRQPGVRALGSYWGATGENIDMQSGNLNFSLPLIKAGGRGVSLSVGLSYNSQLWRKDPAGTWKFGTDTGFGFGWRLTPGMIVPYYTSYYGFDHYSFFDSTGAEYRLQNAGNGLWTSRDGLYITYDAYSNRLWFNDGSFWYFGCQSAGIEADAGVRYPTLAEDSNGNQITLTYQAGTMAPATNTSSRLTSIVDVRGSHYIGYYQGHLTSIANNFGASESYTFTTTLSAPLSAPFAGSTGSYGTTALLTSMTDINGLSHSFEYNASGELTGVTLPYGGRFGYDYQDFTFANGQSVREVLHRKLRTSSGGADSMWIFWSDPDDPTRLSHRYHSVSDPTMTYDRLYFFGLDSSAPSYRLETDYLERRITDWKIYLWRTSAWTLSSSNQPYIWETTNTLDPSTPDQKVSKTQQSLDGYGNMVWQKVYDYGDLTNPVRTYQNTYLSSSNYTSRYVRNRVLTSTLTSASGTRTLVSRTYDTVSPTPCPASVYDFTLAAASGVTLHESSVFTSSYLWRGNAVVENRLGKPTQCTRYDITGNVVQTGNSAGQMVAAQWDSSKNYAVPSTLTPNSNSALSQSMTYNSFLGVTQVNSPNGVSQSYGWDSSARPASSQSPHGAITSYAYTNSPPTTTATVNGRWTKTTMDGLGRTIKVETGSGTTTLSITETEYGLCACTPLGKVYRVSRPHAPGVAAVWTTYTYDARGRTVQVSQPNNLGATTYSYAGNVVTVTDPAGRWKKYTTDAMGNLVHVTEPNPQTSGQTYETSYFYNDLNQLTRVEMPRPYQSGTYTQVRTWAYNSLGQLASETQPETGTTSYTYDAVGRLASKTDAASRSEQYTYDTYNRMLTKRSYQGAGELVDRRVDFVYDTATNGMGKVAAINYYTAPLPVVTFQETYSYTAGGLVTQKSIQHLTPSMTLTLTGAYTYDNEGRLTSQKYPDYSVPNVGSVTGRTLTYSYDTYGRLSTTSNSSWGTFTTSWNAAGQLTSIFGSWAYQSFQYDTLGRLTRETAPGGVDFEYRYSSTYNDGKVQQRKDYISGEEVTYQYDQLGRLSSAQTTGPEWGFTWVYDGFGNRTQQNLTKGTGPSINLLVDPATNRATSNGSYTYDATGNQSGYQFDIDHRPISGDGNYAIYRSPSGERFLSATYNTTSTWDGQKVYFYNPWGEHIADYRLDHFPGNNSSVYFTLDTATERITVAGRPVIVGSSPITQDRLGSIMSDNSGSHRYYPYGEEIGGATAQNKPKFATYTRMADGLDDAVNRFYNPTWGRFTSPDPFSGSAIEADPGSWNRYTYSSSDPTNNVDPLGLMAYRKPGLPGQRIEIPVYGNSPMDDVPGMGGGGGKGGGGQAGSHDHQAKRTKEEKLQDAATAIRDALEKPECAALFNAGKGKTIDLLNGLLDGHYGEIKFADLVDARGNRPDAETSGREGTWDEDMRGWMKVDITLNSTTNYALGFWENGSDRYRNRTLLHELGHVANMLVGAGGSQFSDNDTGPDGAANQQFNQDLELKCFP